MENNSTLDTGRTNGPGSLAEVAADHSAGPEEGTSKGRPRAEVDLSTPEGRAIAARRERERVRYAGKSNGVSPRVAAPRAGAAPADLFKPETCQFLVRLPFDVAAAALKSETWTLDANQEKVLAGPCAETLNQFFPETSPKWAALTALSLALISITGQKYLIWREEQIAKSRTDAA